MMPSASEARRVDTSGMQFKPPPSSDPSRPIATPVIPQLPAHYTQSPVMISSLPGMATLVDGITRQFYGGARVPTRRVVMP